MADRDRFELDLAAALRTYADDAPTQVRPTELARQFAAVYPHGRTAIARWSFGLTPALAWTLLIIGLLFALMVGGLLVGAYRQATRPSVSSPAGIGLVWDRVDDPDLVGPNTFGGHSIGGLGGVIAGGPGAIAWGAIAEIGPGIWTTTDGLDWTRATLSMPPDAHLVAGSSEANNGTVTDVTAGGPGFVAIGNYPRATDIGSIIWTSVDGMAWDPVAVPPATARLELDSVVSWRGGLLAFGCVGDPAACAPRVWTSLDGSSWAVEPLSLPAGIAGLGEVTSSSDRLWAPALPIDSQAGPSPMLATSTDGRTWSSSTLRQMPGGAGSPASFHPLADGLYALVPFSVDGAAAGTRGVYRSTDMATWTHQSVGLAAAGNDLIAVGDTLVMVGDEDTATCRSAGLLGCRAMGWRSLDAGVTWQAIASSPAGSMKAVAALRDGTLVAVGSTEWFVGIHLFGSPTVWVSPPVRR